MKSHTLRPWTEVVRLHPDVEGKALTEAVFAIDLGAIAVGDPEVPIVNRDPEAFFRATYITMDLRRLLEEVLASLAGQPGYNRVLKLRTPFGGGKFHTLATLLHAARSRQALNLIPEAQGMADPGKVAVAVFDGEKFDARSGKAVSGGPTIRTMWGWLAWQLGEDKFEMVEGHDRELISPGGDVIREMLAGGPKLILLDEMLKYMERAAAMPVLDSTLQRQSKDFFQNLTVEVSGSANTAMVYALTWSARESLGNIALLEEIDKLASRVDQLREPVSGDEILPILQKRLLGEKPPEPAATEVAQTYSQVVTQMRLAELDTPGARSQAESEGLALRDRIKAAYPFHPALIDCMKERWCSVEAFQRTRGSLRFLASCLYALKNNGGARALLGPAEIPLKNVDVRIKMLKDLGAQNDYDPVITADIEGPNARARRIDDRLGKENPIWANIKPATRLATAVLVYSFGGLRKEGGTEGNGLPPGVTERELLAACVGPDIDSITAKGVLAELRTNCLFLHYDGVRYCFRKDPNVTKLIEDAEQEVGRDPQGVNDRIRELLEKRLAGHRGAIIWPRKSQDLPDEEPRFLIGYMSLEFAWETKAEQEKRAKEVLVQYGEKPRRYRNGIGLAIPDKKQIASLKRAVRYLMAIERVDARKSQHRLTKDQLDQLKERRRTEEAAAEAAFRHLYNAVWLPRVEDGRLEIEPVEIGGRPLQATGIHERIMELLTAVGTPKVFATLKPGKVVERMKLGEPQRLGVKTSEVRDAFFSFLDPPRLEYDGALSKAIVRGVAEGVFAYVSGVVPTLGEDGKYPINRDKVVITKMIAEDEVDLESGFIMMPEAIPAPPQPEVCPACGFSPCRCSQPPQLCPQCGKMPCVCGATPEICQRCGQSPCVCPSSEKIVSLKFKASRDQVYKAFPAIANLADKSDEGKVTILVEASAASGYDPNWLRNAVDEPLEEADIEKL
jgi:uncharacterized protein